MLKPETALNIWIKPACLALELHLGKPQINTAGAHAMLLRTMAVESDLIWRRQVGGGPGSSLLQVEPKTVLLVANWANRVFPDHWAQLLVAGGHGLVDLPKEPLLAALMERLEVSQFFAAIIARLLYWSIASPLPPPMRVLEQARYWKDHYNTDAGQGTIEDFTEAWRVHLADFERSLGWVG